MVRFLVRLSLTRWVCPFFFSFFFATILPERFLLALGFIFLLYNIICFFCVQFVDRNLSATFFFIFHSTIFFFGLKSGSLLFFYAIIILILFTLRCLLTEYIPFASCVGGVYVWRLHCLLGCCLARRRLDSVLLLRTVFGLFLELICQNERR